MDQHAAPRALPLVPLPGADRAAPVLLLLVSPLVAKEAPMPAPRTPLALLPEMQMRYEGPLLTVYQDAEQPTDVYIGARAGGHLDAAYKDRHDYLAAQAGGLETLGYQVRRCYAQHAQRGRMRQYISYLVVREEEASRV